MPLHPGLVPTLHTDESPASICSRVRLLAGRDARDLCLDMGLRFQDVVDGCPKALAALAEQCGIAGDSLPGLPVTKVKDEWRFTFAGHAFMRESLSGRQFGCARIV